MSIGPVGGAAEALAALQQASTANTQNTVEQQQTEENVAATNEIAQNQTESTSENIINTTA